MVMMMVSVYKQFKMINIADLKGFINERVIISQ